MTFRSTKFSSQVHVFVPFRSFLMILEVVNWMMQALTFCGKMPRMKRESLFSGTCLRVGGSLRGVCIALRDVEDES